jgi:hypothetical protein
MACPAFQVPESLLFLRRLHHVTVGRQSFSLHHQNGCSTLLVADSSGTKDYRLLWGRTKCSKLDEASGAATLWPFSLLYFRLWIKKLCGSFTHFLRGFRRVFSLGRTGCNGLIRSQIPSPSNMNFL